jgi:hypothetical protein
MSADRLGRLAHYFMSGQKSLIMVMRGITLVFDVYPIIEYELLGDVNRE